MDSERRLALDDAGPAVPYILERFGLVGFAGLVTLLGAVEPLRLRFKEEFCLPFPGDRDILELKLDTDEEDEDVFFLSVTLLL